MREKVTPNLPEDIQNELNDKSAKLEELNGERKKIFVAVPNMSTVNIGLLARLFQWTQPDSGIMPHYNFVTEKRHHDFARNALVQEFLKSECEYMALIDDDVVPHPNFINLYKHGKDIIAGNVHCWMNGNLMPSIWQKSECEQCFNLKRWIETGTIHDKREYREIDGKLWRWDPFHQVFSEFATKEGILPDLKCRCKGSGMDPFVFRTWQTAPTPGKILRCDSVGAAAVMIHRRVIEKMPAPHFMFLYRHDREICFTEDHYFCWKAQELGFEVWADFEMVCSHLKLVDLSQVSLAQIRAFHKGIEFAQAGKTIEGEIPQEKKQEKKTGLGLVLPTPEQISKVSKFKNA
jgi:hypothetical protein